LIVKVSVFEGEKKTMKKETEKRKKKNAGKNDLKLSLSLSLSLSRLRLHPIALSAAVYLSTRPRNDCSSGKMVNNPGFR